MPRRNPRRKVAKKPKVQLQENGLVSVDPTPKHLVAIRGSVARLQRFSFFCHMNRDIWAARLCRGQLEAVRSVSIQGACVIDDGGDDPGGCRDDGPTPPKTCSALFPNLRRIGVCTDPEESGENWIVGRFTSMAREAGLAHWSEWVQLMERSDVEVVELSLLGVPV
ncbi:hypothetical protein CC86DRAFT_378145 [Ophiobolus disseminans]|uniref:Uncharacterized protein n=1 Tax=Ophiobolus disseminans TaxID=1469910 RepID=A0A6A7AD83_9PLEO|nr:hypothetical protein CC86DRAFT_378145 [Ophiobolus disseminans]